MPCALFPPQTFLDIHLLLTIIELSCPYPFRAGRELIIRISLVICSIFVLLFSGGCNRKQSQQSVGLAPVQVIATLFPVYDMARAISGGRCDVRLLLPPGTEAHSFDPRPDDMIRISRASIFIFTNRFMEPWAEKLAEGSGGKVTVVNAGAAIPLLPAGTGSHSPGATEHHNDTHAHGPGMDPHIWLDPAHAGVMLDTILEAFVSRDPANRDVYRANAAAYRQKLADLDRRLQRELASCRNRTLLHGGHYAFGYLAKRYGLVYVAATGVGADAEPTPSAMGALVKQVRSLGLRTIYAEEMLSPRIAETIAEETGAQVLMLHAGHNVSRDELNNGITFPEIMERNLRALSQGLECRQ